MPKLAQILKRSSGSRQVCVSVFFFSDHCIKQIDSMLPWVCSVIDHRGRQNVVKTTVTHSPAARVPLLCFYDILTSSVIYYRTDARQHGIYLLITPLSKGEIIRITFPANVILYHVTKFCRLLFTQPRPKRLLVLGAAILENEKTLGRRLLFILSASSLNSDS